MAVQLGLGEQIAFDYTKSSEIHPHPKTPTPTKVLRDLMDPTVNRPCQKVTSMEQPYNIFGLLYAKIWTVARLFREKISQCHQFGADGSYLLIQRLWLCYLFIQHIS